MWSGQRRKAIAGAAMWPPSPVRGVEETTMLRTLFLISCYLAIFGLATGAPFVLTLGYEWVELLRPAGIVYGFAKSIPFALLIGVPAIGSYFLFDRRDAPRAGPVTILTAMLAVWVTLTTTWAAVPEAAWSKWDPTLKTLLFSLFIPFVIRSRNQIEAFVQVYIFSLAANVVTFGAKTLLTGGGYREYLGLSATNKLMGEGADLAMASLVMVPFILFVMKHGRIFPKTSWVTAGYVGLIVLALATTIGTHERTGLVGMLVLGATVWWYTRYKFRMGLLCLAAAVAIAIAAPASWYDRMSTITADAADRSSQVRLLVWKWTLDYVKVHPFGGGFEVYLIDEISTQREDGTGFTQHGRAFHSAYFEMLGEHGWPGIALFLAIIAAAFSGLRQSSRIARKNPEYTWVGDLSRALRCCLLINLACGAFIEIGFEPIIWYLIALSFAVREYLRRAEGIPHRTAARVEFAAPAIGF
jgi:probable O-glycosylation ligase (exosortase A-associated)